MVDDLIKEMHAASRHVVLADERLISGVSLPAGSEVDLDDYDRLVSVRLPAGTTVTLDGAVWRNGIEFFRTDAALPVRIRSAVPAADVTFDGVPCRLGQPVEFAGSGHLRSCTLAGDTAAQAEIVDGRGDYGRCTSLALPIKLLSCSRERQRRWWSVAPRQCCGGGGSSLCAGSEIEIFNGRLVSCTPAAAQIFGGVDIPAGSILHLTNTPHRIERFALPALTSPFRAFGMDLPSQVEVSLCHERWEVDQVNVPNGAYVVIAGVRLTGFLDFDCGLFRDGSLSRTAE